MAILDDIKQNYITYLPYANPSLYPDSAAAQSQIDSTQSIVDSLDSATLLAYNQMYLPIVFTGSESTYQATYDSLATKTDQELRDGVMALVLYYTIKTTTVQGPPDLRGDYTLMERFIMQATIPSDSNLLSRTKIKISDPDPVKWPYSTPGFDYLGQESIDYNAPILYSNWRGAVIPLMLMTVDYNDVTNTIPNVWALPPSDLASTNPFVKNKIGPVGNFVNTFTGTIDAIRNYSLIGYNTNLYTPDPGNYYGPIPDEIILQSGVMKLFNSGKTNTICIESDQNDIYEGYVDATDSSRQIYAGSGGIPFVICENRDAKEYNITQKMQTGDAENPPPGTWKAYFADEYTIPTWNVPTPPFSVWFWTRTISAMAKEEWPSVVTVTLRDPNTDNVISERNMPCLSNMVKINSAGDIAWVAHIRDYNYAYDYERYFWPRSDKPKSQHLKDPWQDDPYIMLPESGNNEYILEITRPSDPTLPASNNIDPIWQFPIITVQYMLDTGMALSELIVNNGSIGILPGELLFSYVYNSVRTGLFSTISDAETALQAIIDSVPYSSSSGTLAADRAATIAKLDANGFQSHPDYANVVNYINTDPQWRAQNIYYRGLLIYEAQLGFA